MSVTVNDKGGNEQRVNLIKRGVGDIQHVMLKNKLIKKAENYHLLTDRFVTNNLPGIMQNPRQLIEIRPRGPLGAEWVRGRSISRNPEHIYTPYLV